MDVRLLEIICCPACKAGLVLRSFVAEDNGRIRDGSLHCACGLWFPIIHGVPRLLLPGLRDQLREIHAEYYRAYAERLPEACESGAPSVSSAKLRTQESFGHEWTEFSDYAVDNFSAFIRPLEHGFFRGKFGLDVGCGAGRHAKQATSLGAEVVGMDLSQAVDSAARLNRDNPTAHFVQADVFNLPFRDGVFDFIYSLGVMHHFPAPEEGFRKVAPTLKPGGTVCVWVYQRTRRKEWLELARRVTVRLPMRLVQGLAWAAAVVDYGIFVNAYRWGRRVKAVSRWTPLRIKEYAGYDFSASYTDWFDRLAAPISHCYNEAEIRGWFERAGLRTIDTSLVGDSWVWGRGCRDAS